MPAQNIGKYMAHGYAGAYARQPDMIVDTHPLGGGEPLLFGSASAYGTGADEGKIVPFGSGMDAARFAGVAVREVKSATTWPEQNVGRYLPNEAVPVMKRGCVNVFCAVGTPALNGKVYIRIAANESIPVGVVGGFEAQGDGANTVELPNCRWRGGADVNGIAEIRILSCNNA